VPQAGIAPFAIGVISTAKVLPLFNEPAEIGSNITPAPVVVVPVMLVLVEFVDQPVTSLPVGQADDDDSLKYQRHVYAPEPTGFVANVMFDGLPLVQNVSLAESTVPGLNAGRTVICLTPPAQDPVPLAGVTKHA
jgi:hypothetical protein